jgi:hypothetical protein
VLLASFHGFGPWLFFDARERSPGNRESASDVSLPAKQVRQVTVHKDGGGVAITKNESGDVDRPPDQAVCFLVVALLNEYATEICQGNGKLRVLRSEQGFKI